MRKEKTSQKQAHKSVCSQQKLCPCRSFNATFLWIPFLSIFLCWYIHHFGTQIHWTHNICVAFNLYTNLVNKLDGCSKEAVHPLQHVARNRNFASAKSKQWSQNSVLPSATERLPVDLYTASPKCVAKSTQQNSPVLVGPEGISGDKFLWSNVTKERLAKACTSVCRETVS